MQPIELVNPERFWKFVDTESDGACWLWTGRVDRDGYGDYMQSLGRRGLRGQWRAHRVAYELLVGPIPSNLVIDHLCRVRNCVNPDHLEPVTNRENAQRSPLIGRAPNTGVRRVLVDGVPYCSNGHAVIGPNARPLPKYPGLFACLQCQRDGTARFKAKHAA